MAAYNSQSKKVKNALKAILTGITYDTGAGAEPAFTNIAGTTHGEFDSYPSLRILPGDQRTDKVAVAENERTLTYICRTHLPIEDKLNSEATYDYMYDLTDLVLDVLDKGDFTRALTAADATLTSYILNATRGDWSLVNSKAGVLLICDIDIEIRYGKDLF